MAPRRRRTREETRRLILEAAHQLFAEPSVHDVRLEDIANAAGISRQAIYLHFATREELVRELVQHMSRVTGLPKLLETFYASPTGEAMLEALVEIQVKHNPAVSGIGHLIDADRRRSELASATYAAIRDHRRSWCREVVTALRNEGKLASGWTIPAATNLLYVLTSLRVWQELVEGLGFSPKRYRQAILASARGALI
jgi:AcrR family transcriptional regulator